MHEYILYIYIYIRMNKCIDIHDAQMAKQLDEFHEYAEYITLSKTKNIQKLIENKDIYKPANFLPHAVFDKVRMYGRENREHIYTRGEDIIGILGVCLSIGYDINIIDDATGQTLLHSALNNITHSDGWYQIDKIVTFLIDNNIDCDKPDKKNITVFEILINDMNYSYERHHDPKIFCKIANLLIDHIYSMPHDKNYIDIIDNILISNLIDRFEETVQLHDVDDIQSYKEGYTESRSNTINNYKCSLNLIKEMLNNRYIYLKTKIALMSDV